MKEQIEKELSQIKERLKPPSITVIGGSGAGKSSLIKTVFNLSDEEIGVDSGFPQTQYYQKYPYPEDPSFPIILYDSPGYEPGKTNEWLQDTIEFLTSRSTTDSVDEKIHLIWYVISASAARIFYFDKEAIETATSLGLPVIVVLSKCDIAKDEQKSRLKSSIKELRLNNLVKIIEISAAPLYGEKFGLEELVNDSIEMIPKGYTEAFISAQVISIKKKRKVAWAFVSGAAASCFSAAYIPVPGSTPAAILTTQTTLIPILFRIYNIQRISTLKSALVTFSASTILTLLGTTIMDGVSTFAVLLFPPLFIAGEAVSGGTAATYIVIIGLSYISTLESISTAYLESEINAEDIESFFKKKFTEELKKYSRIKISRKSDIDRIGKEYIDS